MIKYYIITLLLLIIGVGCVYELEQKQLVQANFVVVDGVLNFSTQTDENDLIINIGESRTDLVRPIPISKANVILSHNKGTVVQNYTLVEKESGAYYLTQKIDYKKGDAFQLFFQIGEKKYESDIEVLPDSVALKNVYSALNPKGTAKNAFEIFVDTDDQPAVKNFYRWKITDWEKQQICQFCYKQGRNPEYCNDDMYGTPDVTISRNNRCDGECYDILRFSPNNSIGDVFFDGKPLIKKSVGFVPFVFVGGCLVEVQQNNLTPGYFAFLEKLKAQAENTGGLADTPASLLTGNVKNITNNAEKVVGYFSVTNTTKKRFWLDRGEGLSAGIKPLANINPPLDPPIPAPPLWYPVPCKPSKTRTNLKPTGFR